MAVLRRLFGDDSSVLRDSDFQALLLANVLPPLGTAMLSPILASLIDPFGTTAGDVGLLISFFTAPPILVIPLAGAVADRRGRKPVLVGSLLLFGAAGSAIALTTDFRVALALRFLQGVAYGGITPVIITSLGDIYDATEEATAQGIRFTGSGLTQTVFPLLAGVLVLVAWQYPFLLYAMAFPVAAVVHRYFDEPTAAAAQDATPTDGGRDSYLRSLAALARQRRVAALVGARALPVVVWIAFLTYNSIVVRQLGGTPAAAGALVAVGSLSYAAGASQAGRLTALFESRYRVLLGSNLALGAGFAAFLLAPGLAVAAAGAAVAGVGFGVLLGLYRSIVTGLADESLRGGVVSLAESLGRTAATATPALMGGFIAATAPRVGLGPAVTAAGLGAAIVSVGGGVALLAVAHAAPAVRAG